MKKYAVLTFLAPLLFWTPIAQAGTYEGKCLNVRLEEFKDCTIAIERSTIDFEFRRERHQQDNFAIVSGQVIEIAAGEYAQRLLTVEGGVVSRILLGSLASIGQLVYNRDYQKFVIEYMNKQKERQATAFLVDRDDGAAVADELSALTGTSVIYQPREEETLIDEGDIQNIELPNL